MITSTRTLTRAFDDGVTLPASEQISNLPGNQGDAAEVNLTPSN